MTDTTTTDPQLEAILAAGLDPANYEFGVGPGERVYAPHDLPACPSWCRYTERIADHGYDSCSTDGPLTFSRFHTSGQARTAYVTQEEFNRDGVISYGPLAITASIGDVSAFDLSSDAARDAAAALLAAADLRDSIEATQ